MQENFAYFMRARLDRLAFFQKWLRERFGAKATLNGDGLLALNACRLSADVAHRP